ncbi:MAG: regulatory iron-sulfur-containing complex subunit RicT [Planctomycetota bacterium]|nr:regulatory iron-sulfur-containing complex subunit RicT [Planctomycetota bacterium]
MSDASTTRPKQAKSKKYMLVRYGRMDTVGLFEHNETRIPKLNGRVVVKTEKGLELGYLVGRLTFYKAGQMKLSDDQIKTYFSDSESQFSYEQAGKFIRFATAEDVSEEQHLQKIAKEEVECCKRFAKEMNLPMKVVEAEHIFGGERIIFYFKSDSRVDFRELVKKLAQEYQTRIEMRQIGSRDEAKLLGDVESCGQECCCKKFLKILKPVNMRMAKMQKATLDPSKISGYCGRLKCCLRYEDKTYIELKNQLPKKNTRVKTNHGEGKVVDAQILTQLVVVEYEDGEKIAVPISELQIIGPPPTPVQEQDTVPEEDEQDTADNQNQ